MISVFGDESADETKQRVFAVAGVIGGEQQWENLEEKWRTRIGDIPFHANDCESDQGDYKGIDHQQNQDLYKDLTQLLATSGMGGWGFAIDLQAQRRVLPGAPDISYYKCFVEVLDAMLICAAYNKETVKFTFDMRSEGNYNSGLLYKMLLDVPALSKHLFSEISFACHRKNVRVQVGDLLARETMKSLEKDLSPKKRKPRKSWLALAETGNFHIKAVGEEYFEDLKRQMPTIQGLMGIKFGEYREWLRNTKRQDNLTNYFLFLEFVIKRHQGKHE